MKLTKAYLEKVNACGSGIRWFTEQDETDGKKVVKKLMKDHLDWANWLICRIFNKKQKVMYAIYAAKQVLSIYEKEYPDDKRPRKAIEAAQAYLDNPCKKTKADAYVAAAVAAAAAATAAAYAAAYDDDAAAATYAAYAATYDAGAYAARKQMRTKILTYGMSLLRG